jgi:acyl-CoA synthetase (NDP forming)
MQPLMNPRSVGIIGASPTSPRSLRALKNLTTFGFQGQIYPINPKYDEVLGLRCYPSAADTPEPAELVVLAIPASGVPDVLEQAFSAGVKAALVLAAGFGEMAGEGQERHRRLRALAERGMLMCGPNCYGVLNVHARSGAWGGELPRPMTAGNVALVSQSGGSVALIANPLMEYRGIGFSFFVSCGNQAGATIEDYFEYLVDDPHTEVIAAFVEGFRQPRRLPRIAARAAAKRKPIIILKVGRSEEARRNALSHTGSMVGDVEIIDALLSQHGIVQVPSLDHLLEVTTLFALGKDKPAGRRLATLSGSGGECGRVSDTAQGLGLQFPPLSPSTAEKLRAILPEFGSPANPFDGTGALQDYPDVFPAAASALLDEDVDVFIPNINALPPNAQGRALNRNFARQLVEAVREKGWPRLVAAYGARTIGAPDRETVDALREAGIPYLESTEKALRAVAALASWQEFLAEGARASVPIPNAHFPLPTSKTGVLPFTEARALLEAFGIPVVQAELCGSLQEAVAAAERFDYPVALKIESPDIVHKTDAGGVRLGCGSPAAVRQAYEEILASVSAGQPAARIAGVLVQPMAPTGVEMILGVKADPLAGPAVLLGLGGIFTEILRDVALRVPPLEPRDASAMVEQLRGRALLRGARGRPPADVAGLEQAILHLGELAMAAAGRLAALDINPLLVLPDGQGVLALDALIELR